MRPGAELKWLLALLIPVAIVLFLHHLTTGFTIYNDGRGYYMYLRSAVIDHDLDFENEWAYYNSVRSRFSSTAIAAQIPEERTPKGRIENIYLIGSAVMWAPFFLLSHAAALFLHSAGLPVRADGFGLLYEAGIGLASLIYGFLGIWLIFRFCRKWFEARTALLATVAVWYGTAAFWYHGVEPSMAHMNSLFLGAGFALFWYNTLGRRTRIQWLLLGLLLGLVYLVRQQDILLGLLPVFEVLGGLLAKFSPAKLRKAAADFVLFGVAAVAAIFPQMLVWKLTHGRYLVYSYANTAKYWHWTFPPQLLALLFSSTAGMWRVPLMMLSLAGLFLFARRIRGVAWYFFAVVAAEVILTSAWTAWPNGYGIRFLLGMSVFFALGAAEVIRRLRMRLGTKATVGIIVFLIAANFVNMLLVMLGEVTSKVPLSEFPRAIMRLIA